MSVNGKISTLALCKSTDVQKRGKALPLKAWKSPQGSRRLRHPEFLDSWHMKVARLSALCTG